MTSDVGDKGALDANFYTLGNFNFHIIVINHFRNLSDYAAASNDSVIAADGCQHGFTLFGLLTLRPQDQEIHDHEDQNEWKKIENDICTTATGGLGICWGHKHRDQLLKNLYG